MKRNLIDICLDNAIIKIKELADKPYCHTCQNYFDSIEQLNNHECDDFDYSDYYRDTEARAEL